MKWENFKKTQICGWVVFIPIIDKPKDDGCFVIPGFFFAKNNKH